MVGITINLNIGVLTQLRVELFWYSSSFTIVLVGYLLKTSALAAVQIWPQYCGLPAAVRARVYITYLFISCTHVQPANAGIL